MSMGFQFNEFAHERWRTVNLHDWVNQNMSTQVQEVVFGRDLIQKNTNNASITLCIRIFMFRTFSKVKWPRVHFASIIYLFLSSLEWNVRQYCSTNRNIHRFKNTELNHMHQLLTALSHSFFSVLLCSCLCVECQICRLSIDSLGTSNNNTTNKSISLL